MSTHNDRDELRQEILGGINRILKSWVIRLSAKQRKILEAQRSYWSTDEEALDKLLFIVSQR